VLVTVHLDAIPAPPGEAVAGTVILVILVVAALVVVSWIALVERRRRLVVAASSALAWISELNARWGEFVATRPSIDCDFEVRVESKGKFDRFNLESHLASSVLEYEGWFEQEIRSRLDAMSHFDTYCSNVEAIASARLGNSGDRRVSPTQFARIEAKEFARRRFEYPVPLAQVSATVRYTSPQGKNSYADQLEWDFDQLRQGLETARAARARMSTARAMRQRERNLMTASVRMNVLQRDSFRCQMCGATASDGATLHIDHIVPISRGGRTSLENLQTLCDSCNLGKSNRFVG